MELSLGSPEKRFLTCEEAFVEKLGKSAVAAGNLKKGQKLKEEDICLKVHLLQLRYMCRFSIHFNLCRQVSHPRGHNPNRLDEILGRTLARDLTKDEPIQKEHLE